MTDIEMPDESPKVEARNHSQKLEDEIRKLAQEIKHHEDNLQRLQTQTNNIEETILDLQVRLGKYHVSVEEEHIDNPLAQTEKCIIRQHTSAAGILCRIKKGHAQQASTLLATKDVLGVVATLGKVNDDNLSRLFSEFLGLETMLGLVCKTYRDIEAFEKYDKEGIIDKSFGLHGLGASMGRSLKRYPVYCLELLRPYVGEFVAEDSQKQLALLKPRLLNGECPPGFLGFAVNMIIVDHMYLSCLTAGGHGLRETLFYSLFSRLQVYKTRAQMIHAIPCISDGAVSLDGGMIKSDGLFFLGDRHRFSDRYEAHLLDKNYWDPIKKKNGRLVYLGLYKNADEAARPHDLAALKYWGQQALLNYPASTYSKEYEEMQGLTTDVYITELLQRSRNYTQGLSKYRGVSWRNERWEASISNSRGSKCLNLGSFGTEEEAAQAYDRAVLRHRVTIHSSTSIKVDI